MNDVQAGPLAVGEVLVAGTVDSGEEASSSVPLLVSQADARNAEAMSSDEMTTRRAGRGIAAD